MPSPKEISEHENYVENHINEGMDIPLNTMMHFVRDPRILGELLCLRSGSVKGTLVELIYGIEARQRYDDLAEVAFTGLSYFKSEYRIERTLSRNKSVISSRQVIRGGGDEASSSHRRRGKSQAE